MKTKTTPFCKVKPLPLIEVDKNDYCTHSFVGNLKDDYFYTGSLKININTHETQSHWVKQTTKWAVDTPKPISNKIPDIGDIVWVTDYVWGFVNTAYPCLILDKNESDNIINSYQICNVLGRTSWIGPNVQYIKSICPNILGVIKSYDLNYSFRGNLVNTLIQANWRLERENGLMLGSNKWRLGKWLQKINHNYDEYQLHQMAESIKLFFIDTINYEWEILEGSDIRKAYDTNNYFMQAGTLGESCMNNNDNTLVYSHMPCKMLCLKTGGKIVGRALLWNVDGKIDGEWQKCLLLDRSYTIIDRQELLFYKWAEENGAWTRPNSYEENPEFKRGNKRCCKFRFEVPKKLKHDTETDFPYMDSFWLKTKKWIRTYRTTAQYIELRYN